MDDDLVRNLARMAEYERGCEALLTMATTHWWAWDAARLAMPEIALWPRPERRRGRDAYINVIRDSVVYHEVEDSVASGMSYRAAYRAVADSRAMLTAKAIEQIHRKMRQSLARNS